jgi:hypothetical protein
MKSREALIAPYRFTGEVYERKVEEMLDPGGYIDLEAWGFHFLKI